MQKDVPTQIKAVAIIFFIVGGLGLVSASMLYKPSFRMSYLADGEEYIPLPGTSLPSQSLPASVYNALIIITVVLSVLYIIEGFLLFKLVKFSFLFGIILSVFMALSSIIGIILGVINIYLLVKNKAIFKNKKA